MDFCFFISVFFREFSPISFRDNADQGLSRVLHDINFHLGGNFAHNINGGTDFYGVSGQVAGLITLEKILFNVFPIWLGVLIHKFLLIVLSFVGSFLLFSKGFSFNKIHSLYLASLLSIINPWATYNSFQHGVGYAIIYLAIYVYLYRSNDKYFFIYSSFLSLLIATSISPMHSLLTLATGLALTVFLKKPSNIKKSFISIFILFFLIFINWIENIYGVYIFGELSTRLQSDNNYLDLLGGIPYINYKTNYCFISCNYFTYSPITIILAISLIFLLFNFKSEFLKIFIFIIFCNYLPNLIWLLVNLLNFTKLNSMNFYYMSYYLLVPITFLALKISEKKEKYFVFMPYIFLFFALTVMGNDKIAFFKKIFYEPQAKLHKIDNLKKKEWKKEEHARVITLFPMEEFHPNFSWAYGLESSDGWTYFNTKNYQFFWDYGVNKKKYISGYNKYAGTLYVEFKDMIKSIKENNNVIIDQYLDLNLLRLINNNYILSYTPVFGDDIRLISKPNKIPYENLYKNKKNFNSYIEDIESRKKFLKKQPNIYIYEINDVSKRVFFPSKVLMLDGQISPPANYSYMSKNYEKNISYSLEKT